MTTAYKILIWEIDWYRQMAFTLGKHVCTDVCKCYKYFRSSFASGNIYLVI